MAVGDYIWQDGFLRATSGGHHDEVPLGSVSTNERLERVILYANINVVTGDSAVRQTWLDYGVLSLIQATAGSPPPIPEEVGFENFQLRDIVDSSYWRMYANTEFTNWSTIPEQAPHIHHDVSIKRRNALDPQIIWWLWGLPGFTGAGVEVGYMKVWWRLLVQQVA